MHTLALHGITAATVPADLCAEECEVVLFLNLFLPHRGFTVIRPHGFLLLGPAPVGKRIVDFGRVHVPHDVQAAKIVLSALGRHLGRMQLIADAASLMTPAVPKKR